MRLLILLLPCNNRQGIFGTFRTLVSEGTWGIDAVGTGVLCSGEALIGLALHQEETGFLRPVNCMPFAGKMLGACYWYSGLLSGFNLLSASTLQTGLVIHELELIAMKWRCLSGISHQFDRGGKWIKASCRYILPKPERSRPYIN